MSVSFTHPGQGAYRVYFTCQECSFEMSGAHLGTPPHFSNDRVDAERQARDEEFLRTAKFPRP